MPLNRLFIITGLLGASLLSACVTTEQNTASDPHYTSSFVSVAEPGFVLHAEDTFAWLSEVEIVTDAEHSISEQTLNGMQSRFEQRMREQGISIVPSLNDADYWLSASIILGDSASETDLVERYDIAPALNNAFEYDAGTLVMRLVSPVSRRTEWRGAIEVFTDPTQSEAARQARIDHAVDTFSRHLRPAAP